MIVFVLFFFKIFRLNPKQNERNKENAGNMMAAD